jgi:2'-5' RNA ligase
MIRTFLAVELTEDLRVQIGQVQQDLKSRLSCESSKDIRITWVQPVSIHLTIAFLGDTDKSRICIPIERFGVFPRLQQPRVIWVGASESWERGADGARLVTLHRAIEDCCRALGFASEGKPLSPHLTLARIKAGERQVGLALAKSGVLDRPIAGGSLTINAITLMKSQLRSAGPVYTKLWETRLAEEKGPGPA